MAKFVMRPIKGQLVGKDDKTYPHLIKTGDTTSTEVAQQISRESSFSRGDVEGLFTALASVLAGEMASGRTVHIRHIGTFRPLLTLRDDAEPEAVDDDQHRNAASVQIGKVSFIPDEELLWETNSRADLHREKAKSRPIVRKKEQRRKLLLEYLQTHSALTVKEYASLTGLSRSTAYRELAAIAAEEEAPIRKTGSASHRRYVLSEEEPQS
jgi:predicted histone-like DNA-binding protein